MAFKNMSCKMLCNIKNANAKNAKVRFLKYVFYFKYYFKNVNIAKVYTNNYHINQSSFNIYSLLNTVRP